MSSLIELVKENGLLNKEIAVAVADDVLINKKEMKDYLEYVRNSCRNNSYTI